MKYNFIKIHFDAEYLLKLDGDCYEKILFPRIFILLIPDSLCSSSRCIGSEERFKSFIGILL